MNRSLLVWLVSYTTILSAQKLDPKPTTVSGYVFAITEAGDVKPAQMASVSLFSEESAAKVFAIALDRRLEEAKISLQDKPHYRNNTKCTVMLVGYGKALVDTLEWCKAHGITQFLAGETDETGRFEIAVPGNYVLVSGKYLVTVYGRSGSNRAFWEGQVRVERGDAIKIKMSAPTKACLIEDVDTE